MSSDCPSFSCTFCLKKFGFEFALAGGSSLSVSENVMISEDKTKDERASN